MYLRLTCLFCLLLSACGDTVEIKEAAGNAQLVFDSGSVARVVDGQDLTLNRVRVFRSTPNQESPGVLSIVDSYFVQVWGTLAGEESPRFSQSAVLVADESGNLYQQGSAPGSVFFEAPAAGRDVGAVRSYTVTAEDALLGPNFTPRFAFEEVTSANAGADITTISEQIDVTTIPDSPHSALKSAAAPVFSFASRVKYVPNADFATTGRLGCVINPGDDAGNAAAKTFVFANVELGDQLMDAQGVNALNPGEDTRGDDDSLWIRWSESWLVTGLNVNTRTLRLVRGRSAPFYMNRELPGVDTSPDQTSPKPSGLEGLIRSCNTTAAKATGKFAVVLSTAATSPFQPLFSVSNSNGFCQALQTTVEGDASTLALNDPTWGGCNFTLAFANAGSWNGTAHTAPIASAGAGTFVHVEQSAIQSIQF